jgi:4'-phosphopantetheinyl transferase
LVYIYYSYLSELAHEKLLEIDLPKFSKDYQEKIKRYRRWQDAQLSLLGWVLLFKGFEQIYEDNPFDKIVKYTKFNKPYFEDSPIHFNISHSGEIVVCALSDESEIGIDIEILTDIEIEDFKSQMTENELKKILGSGNSTQSFFDYWTQKEAVLKAQGEGLSVQLSSFEVSDYKAYISGEKFFLKEIKIDDKYKCYVSKKKNINELTIKKI